MRNPPLKSGGIFFAVPEPMAVAVLTVKLSMSPGAILVRPLSSVNYSLMHSSQSIKAVIFSLLLSVLPRPGGEVPTEVSHLPAPGPDNWPVALNKRIFN